MRPRFIEALSKHAKVVNVNNKQIEAMLEGYNKMKTGFTLLGKALKKSKSQANKNKVGEMLLTSFENLVKDLEDTELIEG